jgi:hypothetical protein
MEDWSRQSAIAQDSGTQDDPMTDPVVASTAGQLQEVASVARDLWFRPEDVVHDREAATVTIQLTHDEEHRGWFGLKYYVRGQRPAGVLRFQTVSDCRIIDDAKIGTYLFNHFVCEESERGIRIWVVANAPLRVELVAARVAVRFDPV